MLVVPDLAAGTSPGRRRLLRNSIVSPVARHDSLNASAAISWKAILHAERAIDLTQCGMEHMDSPVNGYAKRRTGALIVMGRFMGGGG